MLKFFATSTGNLLTYEAGAGVGHHVALSVVGTDRLAESGYFRAKIAQEKLIKGSSIPYSIVHATQFFEFLKGLADISSVLRNEIWVLSPDGSQRILIANKMNAPLDTNTGLVLKGDVLCTSNSGFEHIVHSKPEEADRTVVCMKGFPVPK